MYEWDLLLLEHSGGLLALLGLLSRSLLRRGDMLPTVLPGNYLHEWDLLLPGHSGGLQRLLLSRSLLRRGMLRRGFPGDYLRCRRLLSQWLRVQRRLLLSKPDLQQRCLLRRRIGGVQWNLLCVAEYVLCRLSQSGLLFQRDLLHFVRRSCHVLSGWNELHRRRMYVRNTAFDHRRFRQSVIALAAESQDGQCGRGLQQHRPMWRPGDLYVERVEQ